MRKIWEALILLALLWQNPFFGYSSSNYLLFFLLALIPQLIGHTASWKILGGISIFIVILIALWRDSPG